MACIAGVIHLEGGEASPAVVRAMLGTMAHRALDGSAVWAEGPAALGHGASHVTVEAAADRLPFRDPEAPFALTADLRVDHREALARQLGMAASGGGLADGAVLAAAYRRWGDRCVEHVVGDYAFAVWDIGARALFCARDDYGTRPFFYATVGPLFAFATELKAFRAVPGFEPRPNETRLADFLAMHFDEPTHTMLEGVWRLPAAHALRLDLGRVGRPEPRVERHYVFEPRPTGARRSDESYVEELRERLRTAVRERMRSAYPVGVQLSGGMDSSAVAAFARDVRQQEGGPPVPTFSLAFDAVPEADERRYVYPIVAQGGLDPHYVPGDVTGPLGNVRPLAPLLDDGPAVGTQHLVWAMLESARQRGARVMLDGVDGDNVISHGELLLRELVRAGDWARYRREAEALGARYAASDQRQDFQDVFASRQRVLHGIAHGHLQELAEAGRPLAFLRALQAAHRHGGLPRRAPLRHLGPLALTPTWLRRPRTAPPAEHPHLAPGFAERVGLADRLRANLVEIPHTTVREAQAGVLRLNRVARAVELAGDYAAAAGVELRHPFYDRPLVEFTLSLPADLSLRDGWTRYILRRAVEGLLPDPVTWRVGKASMQGVYNRGLLELDRALIYEAASHLDPLAGYVDVGYVRGLVARVDELSDQELNRLHAVCGLALWWQGREE